MGVPRQSQPNHRCAPTFDREGATARRALGKSSRAKARPPSSPCHPLEQAARADQRCAARRAKESAVQAAQQVPLSITAAARRPLLQPTQHRPAPSQPSGRRTSSPPPFPSALRHTLPHAMSLDRHVVDRSDESAPLLLPARRGLRVQCESRACGRRKGDEDGRTFPRMGQRTHVRKDGAKVHWLIRWPA